jgi:hypothetical protein
MLAKSVASEVLLRLCIQIKTNMSSESPKRHIHFFATLPKR